MLLAGLSTQALSCACCKALRAVPWSKLFGYSLKLDLQAHQSGECSRSLRPGVRRQQATAEVGGLSSSEDEEESEGDDDDYLGEEEVMGSWQSSQAECSQQACSALGSSSVSSTSLSSEPLTTRWVLTPVLCDEMAGLREEERLQGQQEGRGAEGGGRGVEISHGCLEKIVLVVNIVSSSG